MGQLTAETLARLARSSGEVPRRPVEVDPARAASCPPGLEYLLALDGVVLKREQPSAQQLQQLRRQHNNHQHVLGSFHLYSPQGELLYFGHEGTRAPSPVLNPPNHYERTGWVRSVLLQCVIVVRQARVRDGYPPDGLNRARCRPNSARSRYRLCIHRAVFFFFSCIPRVGNVVHAVLPRAHELLVPAERHDHQRRVGQGHGLHPPEL